MTTLRHVGTSAMKLEQAAQVTYSAFFMGRWGRTLAPRERRGCRLQGVQAPQQLWVHMGGSRPTLTGRLPRDLEKHVIALKQKSTCKE